MAGEDKVDNAVKHRIERAVGLRAPLDPPGDGRILADRVTISSLATVGPALESWGLMEFQRGPQSITSTWREFFEDARYLGDHSRAGCGECKWSMGLDNQGVAWLVGIRDSILLLVNPPKIAHVLACDSLPALKLAWAQSKPSDTIDSMAQGVRAHRARLEAEELAVELDAELEPASQPARPGPRLRM